MCTGAEEPGGPKRCPADAYRRARTAQTDLEAAEREYRQALVDYEEAENRYERMADRFGDEHRHALLAEAQLSEAGTRFEQGEEALDESRSRYDQAYADARDVYEDSGEEFPHDELPDRQGQYAARAAAEAEQWRARRQEWAQDHQAEQEAKLRVRQESENTRQVLAADAAELSQAADALRQDERRAAILAEQAQARREYDRQASIADFMDKATSADVTGEDAVHRSDAQARRERDRIDAERENRQEWKRRRAEEARSVLSELGVELPADDGEQITWDNRQRLVVSAEEDRNLDAVRGRLGKDTDPSLPLATRADDARPALTAARNARTQAYQDVAAAYRAHAGEGASCGVFVDAVTDSHAFTMSARDTVSGANRATLALSPEDQRGHVDSFRCQVANAQTLCLDQHGNPTDLGRKVSALIRARKDSKEAQQQYINLVGEHPDR
jgi:hypothetical protein